MMQIINTQGVLVESENIGDYSVGQKYRDKNGDEYLYCKNGAVALSKGVGIQRAVADSNVVNVTVATTAAVGATSVTLDAGAAVAANAYEGGSLLVNDATGQGEVYEIKGNPVLAAAGELTVYLKKKLRTILTVDVSEVTLIKNEGLDVVKDAGTAMCAGVPLIDVTAGYYFFSKIRGIAPVLQGTGSNAINTAVVLSAGACIARTAVTETIIGTMVLAGVDTEFQLVKLNLG